MGGGWHAVLSCSRVGIAKRLSSGGAPSPILRLKQTGSPYCVFSPPVGDCIAGARGAVAGGVEGNRRIQESHPHVIPQTPWSPGSPLSCPSQPSVLVLLILFVCFFLAVMSLRCCTGPFSTCGEWRLLLVAVCGLLVALASLIAENRLQAESASVVVTDAGL